MENARSAFSTQLTQIFLRGEAARAASLERNVGATLADAVRGTVWPGSKHQTCSQYKAEKATYYVALHISEAVQTYTKCLPVLIELSLLYQKALHYPILLSQRMLCYQRVEPIL